MYIFTYLYLYIYMYYNIYVYKNMLCTHILGEILCWKRRQVRVLVSPFSECVEQAGWALKTKHGSWSGISTMSRARHPLSATQRSKRYPFCGSIFDDLRFRQGIHGSSIYVQR